MKNPHHTSKKKNEINAGKLNAASRIELQIDKSAFEKAVLADKQPVAQTDAFEEIQEDMMNIIEKLSEIHNRVNTIVTRLDKIEESSAGNYKNHQIEIDTLRRDLLGERKIFVYQSVIKSVITITDSLYDRKKNQASDENSPLFSLTTGILDNMQNLLKTLGCESFTVDEGSSFSPTNMECLGFDVGEGNKVIRIERLGYKSESLIIRPCGVIIGRS
jgi:molecular chaperone GrpE (heat shock protein)